MEKPVYAELEIAVSRPRPGVCQAELRFSNPESETEVPPVRGLSRLDPEALKEHEDDAGAYGLALTEALFADEDLRRLYAQATAAAESAGLGLRLRLRVEPSAEDLHALRWELLRDPASKAPLATSERVLLSRFMASADWRQVKIGAKAALSALVAVAAPSNLGGDMAAVDLDGEVERARASLEGIEVTVAGKDEPLTLERLVDGLREGPDVLYLVCHGAFHRASGEPALYLQDAGGKVAACRGGELAERLAELARPPRLAVLASCESAGVEGGTGAASAHAALAPRLAEAGVAAVIAMQGKISVGTVEKAIPVFFRELLRDGRIDRALAVARGAVRDRSDSWMPALFMRLKRGCIWYEPGFAGDEAAFSKWRSITTSARQGTLVPILGPDLAEHVFGPSRELAEHLSRRHRFPLAVHDRGDLAKVAQYVSVGESRTLARDEVLKLYVKGLLRHYPDLEESGQAHLPQLLDAVVARQEDDDPVRILARLPARIYVNACPDPLLIKTLKAAGRAPRPLLCDWRPTSDSHPRAPACDDEPSVERPVVHHVFGVLGQADSLVMTEDDFFDYLIATAEYKLIPSVVRGALTRSSLLFLGFRLDDWKFRVLFRLIMALGGKQRLHEHAHVGVQLDPEEHSPADAERTRKYLEQYFAASRDTPPISVYWGAPRDFLEELRRQLAKGTVEIRMPKSEDLDDWLG